MSKLFISLPLTKVDVAKREVWGRLAEAVVDKRGEVFDYPTSKPYVQEWTEQFRKNTNGESLGNLRAMHGDIAAGKLIAVNFNDDEQTIDIGAKVVDDVEWKKVLERVYTGFSIGGDYVNKWPDEELNAVRYTAKPHEASLADNPAMYGTLFTVVKTDGTVESVTAGPQAKEERMKPEEKAALVKAAIEKAKKARKEVMEGSSPQGQLVLKLKQLILELGLFEGDPALLTSGEMLDILSAAFAPASPEPPAEEKPAEDAGESGMEEPVEAVAGAEDETTDKEEETTVTASMFTQFQKSTADSLTKLSAEQVTLLKAVDGDALTKTVTTAVESVIETVREEMTKAFKSIDDRLAVIEKTPQTVGRPVGKTFGHLPTGEAVVVDENLTSEKLGKLVDKLKASGTLTPAAEKELRMTAATLSIQEGRRP